MADQPWVPPFLQGQQAQAAPSGGGRTDNLPTTYTPIILQDTANVATNGVKVLVYGFAGRGKTRLSRTAPSPIILSAESGLLSLRKEHLPFIEITNFASFHNAYLWCTQAPEARQFQTICIDSISEVAETILSNEKKATRDPRKAYGEMADQVMDKLRQFRDIPGKNVYFSAKQGRLVDQSTGGIMWGPLMPGQQLDQQLPYFTDEVFQIDNHPDGQGGVYSALRTRPDNQYQAKDRSGALDYLEPPDLSVIFSKIQRG